MRENVEMCLWFMEDDIPKKTGLVTLSITIFELFLIYDTYNRKYERKYIKMNQITKQKKPLTSTNYETIFLCVTMEI